MVGPLHILALADDSPYATDVLQMARDLAGWTCGEVHVMSQVEMVMPALVDSTTKVHMQQEAMDARRQELEQHLKALGIQARTTVVARGLLDEAMAALDGDGFVVVGLKGSGGLRRIFIGSTVVKLIDRTTVPVLAVPQGNHLRPPLHLYVAVAPDGPFTPASLQHLVSRLGDKVGRITFFTSVDQGAPSEQALERLRKAQAECGLALPTEVELHQGAEGLSALKQHVADHPNALLVLNRGGRELLDQLFRRFFINELVYEGHVPMVVMP